MIIKIFSLQKVDRTWLSNVSSTIAESIEALCVVSSTCSACTAGSRTFKDGMSPSSFQKMEFSVLGKNTAFIFYEKGHMVIEKFSL